MKAISKKTVFICFVISVLSAGLFAQAPDTIWTRTYGGTGFEEAFSVYPTIDGGYIMAGSILLPDTIINDDVYLVKTDSLGNTAWIKTYEWGLDEYGGIIEQTNDGEYIFSYYNWPFNRAQIVKLDAMGDFLWRQVYTQGRNECALCVQQTFEGGYIIAGTTDYAGSIYADAWLIKTNNTGDTTWTRSYGGNQYDFAYYVRQTSDGGYILVGGTESFGAGCSDAYLIKTDAAGNVAWTKVYGRSFNDLGSSVQMTADGGYIIGGAVETSLDGPRDAWLIKTDSIGDTLWTRTYGGQYDDYVYSVVPSPDGGYLATGHISDSMGGYLWVFKVDGYGNMVWSKTYGPGDNAGTYIQYTHDNNYIISGWTTSAGAGSYDCWLLKFADENGIVEKGEQKSLIPFTGPTIIAGPLRIPAGEKIRVYDICGRNIEPRSMVPGIYFIKYDSQKMQKMIKIR